MDIMPVSQSSIGNLIRSSIYLYTIIYTIVKFHYVSLRLGYNVHLLIVYASRIVRSIVENGVVGSHLSLRMTCMTTKKLHDTVNYLCY